MLLSSLATKLGLAKILSRPIFYYGPGHGSKIMSVSQIITQRSTLICSHYSIRKQDVGGTFFKCIKKTQFPKSLLRTYKSICYEVI